MSYLSSLHPAVSALYFLSVLMITMFSVNPILLMIALLGGVCFFVKMQRHFPTGKEIGFYLLLFVMITVTNPLFSHNGVTPLFFFNGNPVTLEALFYGMDLAVMLVAVVYWFQCLQSVMTADKLLFLFGRISPKISLLISAALRLIPLLKVQAERIRQSQKAMGLFASDTWSDKLKGTVRVYSALITWALENSIDTGSSMKARGYGLKGRSHYSLFSFQRSDGVFLAVIVVLDVMIVGAMANGNLDFSFYPAITSAPVTGYSISAMIAFAILSFLPFLMEGKESLQWNYYRSKI